MVSEFLHKYGEEEKCSLINEGMMLLFFENLLEIEKKGKRGNEDKKWNMEMGLYTRRKKGERLLVRN